MRLSRLFPLALIAILALTVALASEVVLGEWRLYSQSRTGAEAARTFATALRAAERLSGERGPMNAVFAADPEHAAEWTWRLIDARTATDEALNRLETELAASTVAEVRVLVRPVTALRFRLAATRADIDRIGAQPRAERDLETIRGLVARMVALVSDLVPVLNETELVVGAADPRLFKITAVARTAAELREFAGQIGSLFAAPLTLGVMFTEAESFAVERLSGRINTLAQQLTNAVEVADIPGIEATMRSMTDVYLESALDLIERLTFAGRQHGQYRITGGDFVELYVPAMRTILTVRDAALNEIFEAADRNRDGAFRSLSFSTAIAAVIVVMIVGIGLAIHRRVIVPLLGLTRVMDRIVRRAETDVPGTARGDEIGEMARAVKVFQRDAHENDRLRAETEAATRAKSAFLAMMSHEIRTPMNGVMSMAEMLEQTELTEDQRGMSSVIRSSAGALLTIINDILDFSKIEAGKLEIETVPFSLVDVVEEAAELIASRADDKGIGLVVDIDPDIPDRLAGDPTRLRQILLNLMGNAVKFTGQGGVTIRVRADQPAASPLPLRVEVIDTGIGLTAEQRGRLFQAFVQADTSTSRRYGGTGLGLSICQRLCEMMGGRIGVESEAGQGSTFWFELPLAVVDPALDRPSVAIDDARVVAVGFAGAERAALDALLRAAGITGVRWLERAPAGEDPTLYGADTIVMVRAAAGESTALDFAQGLSGCPGAPRLLLAAPRGLASTVAAAEGFGTFAALSLPLRRHRLWHTLAAALGRASLTRRQSAADNEAIGWAPPPAEMARDSGVLILVAEDNLTNQVVIRRLLTQRGYAHEIAANGVEALGLYERQRDGYGLLLTDFHMPEMDGFTLTREIRCREEGTSRRLPIVALTADALPGTEQSCLAAGMDGYLTKPIDSKALTAVLERYLPGALALRCRPEAAAPATRQATGPGIDPEILDMKHLSEMFGSINEDTRAFVVEFVDDVPRMIGDIKAGLAAGNGPLAREAAHALKGAARSAGAHRLGRIASDLQDRLDDNDLDTASRLYETLLPTHGELHAAIQELRAVP